MKLLNSLLLAAALLATGSAQAAKVTIAAAADLKFAMDEIVAHFKAEHPGEAIEVIYGSSGKFYAQVSQGAPYDLFFSADISFAEALVNNGHAASEAIPYAFGRLVLWSPQLDAARMTLDSLTNPQIARIAIANPKHAPYGKRAEEALRAAGLWDKVGGKLVYGENIAHAAQFVQTGNAQVGIIALALALNPALADKGGYYLIPENLHAPLAQAFIITRRAAGNSAAKRFADYMKSPAARATMSRYGFVLPAENRKP